MLKHNKPYKHGYRILTVDRTTSGLDYALLLGKERLSALLTGEKVAVFEGGEGKFVWPQHFLGQIVTHLLWDRETD